MKFGDYSFQSREQGGKWETVPVTWISANDDLIRNSVSSLQGAEELIQVRNIECGYEAYQIIFHEGNPSA